MLFSIKIFLLSLFFLFSFYSQVRAEESPSEILLFDNFENNLDKWEIRVGQWNIENGILIGNHIGTRGDGIISTGNYSWNNYVVEFDINSYLGVDDSIYFRESANGNAYIFNFRHGNGPYGTPEIKFFRQFNRNPQFISSRRDLMLNNEEWYHIKLVVYNENIKLYVNDVKYFDYNDPGTVIKSGRVTFTYWTGEFGFARVGIDNVRILSLNPPTPFLDLPWDYRGQESSFNYMALNPYSWFDHQYPLQNECCNWQVMTYTGETIQRPYRSHNGYDYSRKNGIVLNTPVLAAAAGLATFKPWAKSGGAGNVIKIDHGNGYQTWYEHLSSDGLILSTEGQEVDVEQGQQIGLVGMTGNTDGPHIHFSVFKDSNNNDSFNDEIPYGVTDPLGWSGETTDPWSTWSNGIRSGTTSYNLFLPFSPIKSMFIPTSGKSLISDDTTITVPAGAYNSSFNLIYEIGPFESISDFVTGVTPSFSLKAYSNGQPITTQFLKPIEITINYSKANLTNIKENTLKFRYFNEQNWVWEELPTALNMSNKTISTDVYHFSRFTVMGETKDTTPPVTEIVISGEKGEENWYHTPVRLELVGKDNEDGIGLEYTLYTINGNDWFKYTEPLVFDTEGDYEIIYQSYDQAENQEPRQTLNFHIDKTPPEVSIDAYPKTLWPPNGKMADVILTSISFDTNFYQTEISVDDEYGKIEPTFNILNPNIEQTILLEAFRYEGDLDGRVYKITVISEDLAGNETEEKLQILVPHDQRNQN